MKKVYKTELKMTEKQLEKLIKTIGVCRYLYNLYLQKAQDHYKETGEFLSGYSFDKWINNVYSKQDGFGWIKEVSSKARKKSIMNGECAYKKFFLKKAGFPRFKKKKNQDVKVYLPKNSKTDWTAQRHRIKIPTFNFVRLKEFGYIPENAKVINGTLSIKAGRVFLSLLCDIPEPTIEQATAPGVGIDLGIKNFAALSDGSIYPNINKTSKVKRQEKKLKRESRALARKQNAKKKAGKAVGSGSNLIKNTLRVQKLHYRIGNIREEYRRSIVNAVVKTKPQHITLEDLNVRGMVKNRHLAKAVTDQGFYAFKLFLLAQCHKHGVELRQVSMFYPSSKTCSNCGAVKKHLSLSERTYKCSSCGLEIDRDLNAAYNLRDANQYTILT